MTIENRSLKERHMPQASIGKPPRMTKTDSNHKKSLMHARSGIDKIICHACNQPSHIKYNCPNKHKSMKYIWVPVGTMTNYVGPKQPCVPKISS